MIESVGSRFLSAFCSVLFLAALHPVAARGEAPKLPSVPKPPPAQVLPKAGPIAPAGGAAVAPGPGIPQGPEIHEFSGPAQFIPGEPVPLSWRVGPGLAGGSTPRVALYQGEQVIDSSLAPSGTREIRVTRYPVGATSLEFTLKAMDTGGTSSRILRVPILSAQAALRQLTVGLESDPPEFGPGTPVGLRIRIQSGVWPMRGLLIRVTNGTRVAGELREFMVRAPMMPAMLRDEGFTGESREYAVDIEYQGNRLTKRFPVNTVPYFTLAPAPR